MSNYRIRVFDVESTFGLDVFISLELPFEHQCPFFLPLFSFKISL